MNLRSYDIPSSELKEILSKKPNIFIGISVGKKPMSQKSARDILKFAEENSSAKVVILIADEIQKYNYQVLSHNSQSFALRRSLRYGDIFQELFQKAIASFPQEKRKRFIILRWQQIKNERLKKSQEALAAEFRSNELFKNDVITCLDMHLKRMNKICSVENKLFLSKYILAELPTLFDGIYIDNIQYSFILYPTYRDLDESQLWKLVSDIQNKKKYPRLSCKVTAKKTTLVEFIIDE